MAKLLDVIRTREIFYTAFAGLLLIALSAPSFVLAESLSPSQEVMKTATAGMRRFLTPDLMASVGVLGFHSKEDVNKAVLGEAFEIFTLPPERLVPTNGGLCQPLYPELTSLITSTNRWIFSIWVDGKPTNAMVDVLMTNDKPITEFGTSSFPQLMHQLLTVWPRESGYELRYIQVYSANTSMVEVSQNGKLLGIVLPHGDLNKVLMPSQILPGLCETLKRNMEEDGRARSRGEVILR